MINFYHQSGRFKMLALFILAQAFLMEAFLVPVFSAQNSLDSQNFRIALSDNLIKGEERNDYICAIKSWIHMVSAENNFKAVGQVEIFDANNKKQRTSFKAFDSLVLTPLDIKFMPDRPRKIYIAVQDNGIYTNYIIVVNKKGKIHQIQDLKGVNIEIFNDGWEALARPWVISLLYKTARIPVHKTNEKLFTINTPSKGILKVFFGQCDAVVVRKKAFDIACELNPQLRSGLTVLAQSPRLIPAFMMFNNAGNRAVVKKMMTAVINLHKKERGRQILSFYRGVRMEEHPFSVLNSTLDFLTTYWNIIDDQGRIH